MEKKANKPKDPDYFVVGLQKSGTYWVTALLDAHPQIRCLPAHAMHNITKGESGADEGRIFDMLASLDKDGGTALKNSFRHHHGGFYKNIVPLIGKVGKKKLYSAVIKRYKEWFKFHNKENKPIVGDKTTEYIFHLDMIDDFFPVSKKLCIIRDPRDRIVSWHYHQIRRERRKTKKISDRFIRDYISSQIKKEYENMLDYKGGIHCFTYERLSGKPASVLKEILKYLGANITDEIIDHMINEGTVETLRGKDKLYKKGSGKKRGETVIKSHYRKGISGDWKKHLNRKQVKIINEMIGGMHRKVLKKYKVKS